MLVSSSCVWTWLCAITVFPRLTTSACMLRQPSAGVMQNSQVSCCGCLRLTCTLYMLLLGRQRSAAMLILYRVVHGLQNLCDSLWAVWCPIIACRQFPPNEFKLKPVLATFERLCV